MRPGRQAVRRAGLQQQSSPPYPQRPRHHMPHLLPRLLLHEAQRMLQLDHPVLQFCIRCPLHLQVRAHLVCDEGEGGT